MFAPSDEPFELPRWPEILPALDMPVTLVVESLQVRRLSIIGEGKPRLRIERADGRFTLGDGMLDLPELRIDSDRGPMRFAGFYRPRDNYRTQMRGDAELRLDPNSAPNRVSLLATGHLDDFRLQLRDPGAGAVVGGVALARRQRNTALEFRCEERTFAPAGVRFRR